MLLLLLLLLPIVVVVVVAVWQRCHYWQRRGVAGPCGRPLVGNMLQFALGSRSYGDIYAQLYKEYPQLRYVGFYRLFNEPALVVRDQQVLRDLLQGSNFAHCQDNAVFLDPRRDPQAAQNPFLARGQHWRQRRGELLPLFTPHRLRQTLPHIAAACGQLQRFVRRRLSLDSFEAKTLATRYTLQVIASAVFGLDAQCLGSEQKEEEEEGEEEDDSSLWLSLLEPLFQPNGAWSLAETIALLHSPLLGWLLQHRYVPLPVQRWLHRQGTARSGSNTLLSWLRGQEEKEIEGHAATLLLEGYETSAMLLAFALHELALHPSAQGRLQAELDEVAPGNAGELLQPAALDALKYAEAILYETLRLHPAMPALLKRCTQSFMLPAQRNGLDAAASAGATSLRVSRNTVLIVPVQGIHLDPELYELPQSFRPERFMQQTPQGCSFLGFGAGARMCPGMRLGLAQTKAALATLLRDYNVALANPKQPSVEKSNLTFLTACKGGIWLRLQRRNQV